MSGPTLILASASPRRLSLLEQIAVVPDQIIPADIDETPEKGERPPDYVQRVSLAKARTIAADNDGHFILAADTAVACGRRILPKAEDVKTAKECLALLSGRAHRVYSAVALISPAGLETNRVVETRVKVRPLNAQMIAEYVASDEWDGKAGGYAIQGLFSKHIVSIVGSHPNVVGLPLYETWNLLVGAGWRQ
ncbi:MAG: Maf family nucleotide pyrophosphatase [Pseudomonadota bacterium]